MSTRQTADDVLEAYGEATRGAEHDGLADSDAVFGQQGTDLRFEGRGPGGQEGRRDLLGADFDQQWRGFHAGMIGCAPDMSSH